jgi:hypothetical protein
MCLFLLFTVHDENKDRLIHFEKMRKTIELAYKQEIESMVFKEKLGEYHDFIKSKLDGSEER